MSLITIEIGRDRVPSAAHPASTYCVSFLSSLTDGWLPRVSLRTIGQLSIKLLIKKKRRLAGNVA